MNQTLTQIQEEFDEKFYEGKENCTMCKKHKLYATPTELKSFLTQSNLRVLEKVKEMINEKDWIVDANKRDEHGGSGKETAKIIVDDINHILSTLIEQK